MTRNAFQWAGQPQQLHLPLGNLDPHLMHGSLSPLKSAPKTTSQSVQLFPLGSHMCPTDRITQTDRQTMLQVTSVTTGRIYPMHVMRPKTKT